MNKYSPAPKEIAEAIRKSVPVSAEDALGDGWKNLPVGRTGSASKRIRGFGLVAVSGKGKTGVSFTISKAVRHLKIGGMRIEIPVTANDEFTSKLAHLLKDFLKNNSVKA